MTAQPGDDDADPISPRRAAVGLLVLVAMIVAVLFVLHRLQESARMQDCFASGRTNCVPIDTGQR